MDAGGTLQACENRSLDETIAASLPTLWRAMDRAVSHSPFWKSRFEAWGVDAAGLRDIEGFQSLPLLEKADILSDQLENGPYGTLLAVPAEQLRRIHRTTGTSASPLLVLMTASDLENAVEVGARAFRCAGARPSDVVVHCLNYCMWSGGVTDHQCLEAAGATVIPFGVGNSRFLVQTILRIRPTALSCTPSYLARLRQLLEDEFRLEPADLKLKKAFCGGEGGLQNPEFRRSIEEVWGIRAIDANYGLSDVLSIIAAECEMRDGLHFHAQGVLLPELVDAQGRPVAIVKGASGELVLTNLAREAQPLFRYRTNDLVEIADTKPCLCGRHGFRFRVVGRSDDMVTVKGVNLFASALQGYLCTLAELSGEYRVHAPKPPIQEIRLELEKARDPGSVDWEALGDRVARYVSQDHSVKARVRFLEYGSLAKTDGKTKRLVRE